MSEHRHEHHAHEFQETERTHEKYSSFDSRLEEDSYDNEPEKIDLFALISVGLKQVRRTWLLGLILILLSASFGYWKSGRNYSPSYRAYATYLVTMNTDNGKSISNNRYYNKLTATQLSATFPYILRSGALSRVVAADLGVDVIPGSISANMVGDTNMIEISAVAGSGELAYEILNSVIENYPSVARYVIGNTEMTLMDESGIPTSPVNPLNRSYSAKKFGLLGLLLYLVIVGLLALSRRTVRGFKDLRKYVNISYLGGLPQVFMKRRSGKQDNRILVTNRQVSQSYRESVDSLEHRIAKKMAENKQKSLFVTSAIAGEGKTTTAVNIALMLARKGEKVLLIDADLRNPSVAGTLFEKQGRGRKNKKAEKAASLGLIDILDGKAERKDVVCSVLSGSSGKELDVIIGGSPVGHVADKYTGEQFTKLIKESSEVYDFIIVDTPPCTFMHDTSLIISQLDAGILVMRQDYAPVERVLSAVEILAHEDADLIGCVMNGVDKASGNIGYGYGYGSYSYGKYGYGKYGYGRYSYGKYGYGKYGTTEK